MVRRPLVPLLVLVLVVLSGCAGLASGPSPTPTPSPTDPMGTTMSPTGSPTATSTPTATRTSTPIPSENVTVEGGPLPVDATATLARVQGLVGLEVEPPIVVVNNGTISDPRGRVRPLFRALGLEAAGRPIDDCGRSGEGSATANDVSITPGNLSTEQVELVLVHEYVHVIQGQHDLRPAADGVRRSVATGLVEGGAVYVADAYAEQYDLRWQGRTPLELRRCHYLNATDGLRLRAGLYYFGGRYFQQRVDSPAEVRHVYEDPPRTTEQLIHGLAPDAEPPADLNVTVESGDAWTAGERSHGGELSVRAWLRSELSDDVVREAATGWGEDVALRFGDDDRTGFAWVLRWDSPADADEFVDAVAAYAERVDVPVRLERVGEETVVVFAGDEAFVEGASADGTDGNVTVSPPVVEATGAAVATVAADVHVATGVGSPDDGAASPVAAGVFLAERRLG